MSNRTRAMKRGKKETRSIAERYKEERDKRREACVKEFQSAVNDILKRHNCRMDFGVEVAGVQLPATQVLNCPITLLFSANIE